MYDTTLIHYKELSDSELIKNIECCLWTMVDTYNYWNSIGSTQKCDDFEFWTSIEDLCAIEWDRLKTDLITMIDAFIPVKKGLIWHFFSHYFLNYHWPGIYECVLIGADKNTQQYHCLVDVFNKLAQKTMPYEEEEKWYYPSEFIYIDYDKYTDSFQIHILR